jgi:hypothetical protein
MVIEVGPETKKKMLQKKLKIGWLICNVGDYLVGKRCFKCSRYNHRQQDCRGGNVPTVCRSTYTEELYSALKST